MTSHKELIESLRKKKGLSMQEICGDYVSHSSYSRFIKTGQALSIDKLLYILNRMDLSFREAGLFDHNIQQSNSDRVLMEEALMSDDADLMRETAELFDQKATRTYDSYGMMAIRLRLKKGNDLAIKQEKELLDYLFKVNNWDYKEMFLFTFIMDRMDSTVILHHINRTYQRRAAPLYLERNLNLIILLDEAHFEFLKRREADNAQKMLELFKELIVNRNFNNVQGHYVVSNTLHQLLQHNRPQDYQKLQKLYHNFSVIQATFYTKHLQSRYLTLQPIYQLPDLDWHAGDPHDARRLL